MATIWSKVGKIKIEMTEKVLIINNEFKADVDRGLSKKTKHLPSKYFYDEQGDALFVKIMNMPEYYLTRAEHEILKNQTKDIVQSFGFDKNTHFELIELGAGDGTKTKELLKFLMNRDYTFEYIPIDISLNALDKLEDSLKKELPLLKVTKELGMYFKVLGTLKNSHHPKVVLFLGSNIGNMSDDQSKDFMKKLSDFLNTGDKVLLGVDLIKSREIVLPAYNDSQGITSAFNLNLLERINRELGGNFNLNNFYHQPEYDEEEGIARSFLISKIEQSVYIQVLNKDFRFKKGEKIHTEVSRKYNDAILKKILSGSEFTINQKFTDQQNYFGDYLLIKE